MLKSAIISECGEYRYSLSRIWDESLPAIAFLMLNPSTADGSQDDPTIRRCISYAKQWGYGVLHVVNLFAYRATDPQDLLEVLDPIGPENFYHISKTTASCQCIIFAWGNNANHVMVDKFIRQ